MTAMTLVDIVRLLHAGARLHISVTAEDGSHVADFDATANGYDHRRGLLHAATGDRRDVAIPVDVVDASAGLRIVSVGDAR